MKTEFEIKQEMCEIGKRVYNRGMVASNDGNISVKIAENEFLCTPTGVSKGFMTPDYICKVDAEGKVIASVLVLLTNWIGIAVYYFWARHNLTKWFK